ncbi:hypothetical protein, partial [Methanofollis fontis]
GAVILLILAITIIGIPFAAVAGILLLLSALLADPGRDEESGEQRREEQEDAGDGGAVILLILAITIIGIPFAAVAGILLLLSALLADPGRDEESGE